MTIGEEVTDELIQAYRAGAVEARCEHGRRAMDTAKRVALAAGEALIASLSENGESSTP